MKIDKLDKQILEYLVKDARKPFTEIAKDLLVSPGTIRACEEMESLGSSKYLYQRLRKTCFGFIAT